MDREDPPRKRRVSRFHLERDPPERGAAKQMQEGSTIYWLLQVNVYRSDGIWGNAPLKVGDDFMCETKWYRNVGCQGSCVCCDHMDLVQTSPFVCTMWMWAGIRNKVNRSNSLLVPKFSKLVESSNAMIPIEH